MQRPTGGKLYGTCLVFVSPPLPPTSPVGVEHLDLGDFLDSKESTRRSNTLLAVCVLSALPFLEVARGALSALAHRTPPDKEPCERCLV
jgi:hypothetical protein